MSMKDLPLSLRPRERLLACGAQALAPEELLAVLLRTGLPGQGVMDLPRPCCRSSKAWPGCSLRGLRICSASRAWGRPSGPKSWP